MATVSDIVLLQDLTGSFTDDVDRLKNIIGPLVDNLKNPFLERIFGVNPFFGLTSFKDKPVGFLGSPGDFVYQRNIALTNDTGSIVSAVRGFNVSGGGDEPEAQLEALLQLALDNSLNYRSGSTRIALVITDATFHQPPDGARASSTITRLNNGDNVVDANEDYPTIEQVRNTLVGRDIIPVFIVENDSVNARSSYDQLVKDLGRGLVVGFERGTASIVDAIKIGVAGAREIITVLGNNPTIPNDFFDLRGLDQNGDGIDDDQVVFTGSGNDTVTGGDGNDYIDAGAGDDSIDGGAGNDIVDVGEGNNIALGNDGHDFIFKIDGLSGNDNISGGAGNDTIIGGSGNDNLNGDEGNDNLNGGLGNDNLFGGAGNDFLNGGLGNDRLVGGTGDDNLQGEDGNDILEGGTGNDIIFGGAGNDILRGESGNDTLTGGTGSDIFVFNNLGGAFTSSALGVDQIFDFSVGTDKISLSKRTFTALDISIDASIGSDFAIVTTDSLALGSSAEIIYNSSNGNLFYNQDDALGSFGSGGLFANITNGGSLVSLSASDFVIVA